MKKSLIEARAPRAIALVVAGLFVAVPAVHAAGFQLSEQSVVGMGRAQAGAGIVGDDLSAAFYNPAGMTLLDGTQVQAGGSLVVLDVPFKDQNGNLVENGRDKPALVPNAFLVHRLDSRTVLGLGITAPFGMGVNYGDSWIGRDKGISANIMTVDINPSVGYQLTDKLSVGVGASLQYTSAKLKKGAAPAGTPLVGAASGELEADSWAMGYNLGLMYSFTKDTRIGLSYRSKVDHDANGDYTFSGATGPLAAWNGVYDGSASVTTPDTLLLSGFTRINDQWALSGAVRYSNWTTFDTLVIKNESGKVPNTTINNQWKASWMYSAGADYTLNQRATLRAGLAYETSPVPSAELKNPILPDTDRLWLSFGGSFKLNDKTTLDLAYTHLRGVGDKEITGLGEFKSLNAWIAGAQMQYRF